jgi:hypothetical protein
MGFWSPGPSVNVIFPRQKDSCLEDTNGAASPCQTYHSGIG